MGVLLTIIKVFTILFPFVEIGNILAVFKTKISTLFFQMSVQIYSALGQTEGKRKAFFGKVQEWEPHREIIRIAFGCYERWKKSLLL